MAVSSLNRKFEHDQWQMHEQCVRDVEMGSITPLVFFTFGGMGSLATIAYKQLASVPLAAMRNQSYGSLLSWIRYSTNFSLLMSAVTCLHRVRSYHGNPVNIDLAIFEGQVLPSC